MTYTYKLARRLAISRNLGMLNALLLLAACAGETTAPEASSTPSTPAAPHTPAGFQVLPGTVTIEVKQPVRFRGEVSTLRGHVAMPPTEWEASGGSIDADGTFSAAHAGTFRVVGRGLGRGRPFPHRPDTSVVVVVPRQPDLMGIRVTPRAPTIEAGATLTFAAVGRLLNRRTAPIGVIWTATGGTIDAGGVYQAGTEPGRYRVIATNTRGNMADTAEVGINAPPPSDTLPNPTPDPRPELPALASVVLKPAAVFLATEARHQFAAFGRNSLGDSVAVAVTFRATGGTITPTGLYTAGGAVGSYKVIATSSELADTALVTLAQSSGGWGPVPIPPPTPGPIPGPRAGIPLGLSGLLSNGVGPSHYTMSLDGYTADNIVSRLTQARAKKLQVLMNMTGGHHRNYMTNGAFDLSKWQAKMESYNTPAIKAAIAQAVAEGTVIGNSVMDEPANATPSNNWGPAGTMTKARVDGMCRYAKTIFPTLPVGVVHDHRILEPEKVYQSCDFILSQYRLSKGDVRSFRDGGLEFARRSGIAIAFSMNILHGGTQGSQCEKWGDDPNGKLCPMTGQQLRDWGLTLGTAGCALNMWRYERAYFDKPEVQGALQDIAESLARLPRKPCTRT
ncbi:MAG: hypothetical protein H0T50_12860 [Gemmatimonadales bacterium]|nr:hypothetical protein [Gemmatimonadales bacterium]